MTVSSHTGSTWELAERLDVEAIKLEKSTRRMAIAYVCLAAGLVVYGVWAYVRITSAIEPVKLADSMGEIAVGHALDLIGAEQKEVGNMAPVLVRQAEDAILGTFPGFREDLERSLQTQLSNSITPALKETDLAIVDEIARLPNAEKAVHTAVENPAKTPELFERVSEAAQAAARSRKAVQESTAELRQIREHIQKLAAHAGLSTSEQAERRLVQVVLTQIPLPASDVPVTLKAAKTRAAPRARHAATP